MRDEKDTSLTSSQIVNEAKEAVSSSLIPHPSSLLNSGLCQRLPDAVLIETFKRR